MSQFYEKQHVPESEGMKEKALLEEIYQRMRGVSQIRQSYRGMRQKAYKPENIANIEMEQIRAEDTAHYTERNFIKPLRDELCQKFPDYKEMICLLVNLDRSCEWQYTATHLVSGFGNKQEAQNFWNSYFKISKLFFEGGGSAGIKNGIIGQAGICRALKKIGISYTLATPTQDATEQTDVWAAGKRLQIKYLTRINRPRIKKISEIFYPSTVTERKNAETHYIHEDLMKVSTVRESVQNRSKNVGKEVYIYQISCPASSFDPYTGEPTQEFLARIKPKIEKYFSES